MTKTTISNYIEPDHLAILIRQNGGSAWVERDDSGRDVVITNRSLRWVRKVTKAVKWVSP